MSADVDLGFLVGRRVEYAIRAALDAMPDDVRAERVSHCQQTGREGVTAYRRDEGLYLVWADAPLAFLPADTLTEDSLLGLTGIEGAPTEGGQ